MLSDSSLDPGNRGAACCVHERKIYVNGGWSRRGKTDIFDLVAGKWLPGKRNIYRDRCFHQLLSYRGCVWAVGGDDEDSSDIIEVYNPGEQKWYVNEAFGDALESFVDGIEHYTEYPKIIRDAIVFDEIQNDVSKIVVAGTDKSEIKY